MKKTNLLFMTTMITGTLITLMSNNWLSMWMGLEMNLMSFIPLINMKPSKSSPEASLTYFMVQSMSSILMLSILMLIMMEAPSNMLIYILTMSLLIKLGMAPFHIWMPKIMATLSWNMNILMMTWQKIAPLYMINLLEFNHIMYTSALLSVTLGALMGIYQNSMRKIMAYSSISHMGWLLTLNKIKNSWIMYMLIYSTMIVTLCYYLSTKKVLFISQMMEIKTSLIQKISFTVMMMSLGGLPPLTGFLLKIMVIEEMMATQSMWMMTVMIITSMLTLFFYMRITLKMIMMQSISTKWIMTKNKFNLMMLIINIALPLMIISY
uniref:NADH-ubiquinone oxidoreductase chain 2 n=1 Tax=Urolabida menghaiensis TaxID=1603604 RepID=A0A2K9YV37_9HEMI|nr:NADH dehydrogenase subunit 2 [Urolabida menghaiensis]